jgi:hypothetical protein
MTKQDEIQSDKEFITLYGGSSALAKRLGISVQRVHNWTIRGIPASMKLKNPKLFLKKRK